jgi:protein TonB
LEKLHDAIANNLIYPNQAVFLNLSGIARVSFILFPSGVIQSIKVIKSSGSAILDQAAVATLHKIVPFVPAEKYLKSSQYFTISIGFKVS